MVADMEVDKVDYMEADMEVDKVADNKTLTWKSYLVRELITGGGWLIGPKLFWNKVYPTYTYCKFCANISSTYPEH